MLHKILKLVRLYNAPRWVIFAIDIYIITNTFILAYLIRFNFQLNFNITQLKVQLPIVILVACLSFILVGSYKGIIRHTGLKDAVNITLANAIIAALLVSVVLLNRSINITSSFTIPISIIVIHFLLNIVTLIVSRYLFKALYNFLILERKETKRVLIYGAGKSGLITYAVLRDDSAFNIQIIGFIDDNKSKIGKTINGLKVYGFKELNKKFIAIKKVDEVIISIQKLSQKRLIEVTTYLSKLSITVKIVPPLKYWIDKELKPYQIKPMNVEDLLRRAPIQLHNLALKEDLEGCVVLITGAAGSIGSEIARQTANYKCKQLILIDQAESELYNLQQFFKNNKYSNIIFIVADVRNYKRMDLIFKQYQPTIVYHAAAYKHVPFMEENPYESVSVNISGTKNIADLALKHQARKFVMISTDKAVNPTNVMGATKRIAEMYMSCLNKKGHTKFITTRFGNVLGSNGSVIPLFKEQIKKGGPLTVTHKEITRYFMTIPEACQLVLEAGTMGKGGEIFIFDMGESIKIYDLALNMIHLSGLKYPDDIGIQITGLRPGEKIYEELLGDREKTLPTHHQKIMISKIGKREGEKEVCDKIKELCTLNEELDFENTVLKIKEIVPEFISNNSKFEVLDKFLQKRNTYIKKNERISAEMKGVIRTVLD
ncbi:MAG: nucleoside-diphosphate sugar epimerase/dehydratase [Lutibacter sp.]|uniref:polysaccharide biosynthesis protein n=1 Tax=Lutibacter sp. TaxID=1925666 RepID=UPI00385D2633